MASQKRYLLLRVVSVFLVLAAFGVVWDDVWEVSRGGNVSGCKGCMDEAIELTRYVRSMADSRHAPRKGTLLYKHIDGIRKNALCSDYAPVLQRMIRDLMLGNARVLNVSFNPNRWDMHSLVEYFNKEQGEWVILDPTFSMVVKRKPDGAYATADDIRQATLNKDWSDLDFVLMDNRKYDYYIDYPLLFLNLHRGSEEKGEAESLDPYIERVSLPIDGRFDWYLLRYLGKNKWKPI